MGAYATAADLTSRISLDGGTAPADGVQETLLADAAAAIDAYCRHDFLKHSGASVTVVGNGLDEILLPVRPLLAISAASIDGEALDAGDLAALSFKSYGLVAGVYFPKGADVTFVCDWGYNAPPEAVRRACVTLASRNYRHRAMREKVAEGMRSQSVDGVSISMDPLEMDRDLAKLLEPFVWRRSAR
jgi:hypothetical protein